MPVEDPQLLDALQSLGTADDAAIDPAGTALTLACLDTGGDPEPYRRHLRELQRQAAELARATDSVASQASVLRHLLAETCGYRGDTDTYDDERNANLAAVIDRRRGLPVALGILYLHAARGYGADIVGLSFPSHFLLRLSGRGQRLILDPFNEGAVMQAQDLRLRLKTLLGGDAEMRPEYFLPVSNRDILIRLLNNIKLRAVGGGNLPRAVEILQRMTLLAPQRLELWWEIAVLHGRMGNLAAAITTLERTLKDEPANPETAHLAELLRRLRAQVN
jgi:regulator of sirC expression with transglutaminase-like and TPR domain